MSSSKRMWLASFVVVAILLMIFAWIASFVDDWSRDWNTNVAETSSDSKDASLRPLASRLSARELADLAAFVASQMRRWSVVDGPRRGDDAQDEFTLRLVHRTLIMQFQDDVTVTIRAAEGGSVLNARSQSRIGKGDLGQNPRNLKQLLGAVRRELESRRTGSGSFEGKDSL